MMTATMLVPNGNVSFQRPPETATVADDWCEIVNGAQVVVHRSAFGAHVDETLITVDGYPCEVADWFQALADALTHTAGLRVCAGCGFRFDPNADGRDPDLAADDCGRCVE